MTERDRDRSGRAGSLDDPDVVIRLTTHWRLLVAGPLALAIVVVVVGLLLPRRFTVSASFVPAVPEGGSSQLAGVAASFGVAVSTGAALQTPQLYAELAVSNRVLRAVVTGRLSPSDEGSIAGSLIDYYRIAESEPLRRRDLAVRRLRAELDVQANVRTGLVRVSTRQPSPAVAAAIVASVLREIGEFNVSARRSRSGAEREFVEARLQIARSELLETEARLERFLERNREYRGSTGLVFEHERLQRAVALRQGVVVTLATALEQARIDEVRNTPVVTMVELPEPPGLPDSRLLVFKALAAFGLGALLIGTGLAIVPIVRMSVSRVRGISSAD